MCGGRGRLLTPDGVERPDLAPLATDAPLAADAPSLLVGPVLLLPLLDEPGVEMLGAALAVGGVSVTQSGRAGSEGCGSTFERRP